MHLQKFIHDLVFTDCDIRPYVEKEQQKSRGRGFCLLFGEKKYIRRAIRLALLNGEDGWTAATEIIVGHDGIRKSQIKYEGVLKTQNREKKKELRIGMSLLHES